MSKALKIVVMFVGLVVIVTVFLSVSITSKRVTVENRWSQLETQLSQRNALIQEMLPLIKQYASYEKDLLKKVDEEKKAWGVARSMQEKIQLAKEINSSLEQLLLVPTPFPELRADNNFIKITQQVQSNKSQIAMESLRFNEAVKEFNLSIKSFPGVLIAGFLKITPVEEFSKGKL